MVRYPRIVAEAATPKFVRYGQFWPSLPGKSMVEVGETESFTTRASLQFRAPLGRAGRALHGLRAHLLDLEGRVRETSPTLAQLNRSMRLPRLRRPPSPTKPWTARRGIPSEVTPKLSHHLWLRDVYETLGDSHRDQRLTGRLVLGWGLGMGHSARELRAAHPGHLPSGYHLGFVREYVCSYGDRGGAGR